MTYKLLSIRKKHPILEFFRIWNAVAKVEYKGKQFTLHFDIHNYDTEEDIMNRIKWRVQDAWQSQFNESVWQSVKEKENTTVKIGLD